MIKTIAVTGASGHIGNVFCRLLVEKGYRVRALYHSFQESLKNVNVELVQGDVLNKEDLVRLMSGCDVVVNCAAIISIYDDVDGNVFKTNTEGPANVLDVAKTVGVKKIIHFSSVHAVEEIPLNTPYDETRPYKKSDAFAYDFSKSQGEQIILNKNNKNGIEVVVLRPACVIGPFDFKPSEMGKALIDFYNNKIPALPEGGYNFVDVRDVASSAVHAIEFGKNGEVYLLSGKYLTLKGLTKIVKKVTGKKVPALVMPFSLLKLSLPLIGLYGRLTGAAPLFTIASISALKYGHPNMDCSKAKQQLQHNLRPLEETIRDFYDWQKLNRVI